MYKLIAVYARPEDPAHFRRHLIETHLPLVARFPGLQALRYSVDIDAGEAADAFAVVECDFADEDALRSALSSTEAEAAAADVPNYAAAGVAILIFEPQRFSLTGFAGGEHE
ncbi:EthD family reductase [Caballeronia sordidicola]|uniref:EthD family reductase n=1 Tax=Caballeronia sordidicola TaxID=196367 RepID=UPI000B791F22|nr:EthD family reductase [Caballeronia sordidicola]